MMVLSRDSVVGFVVLSIIRTRIRHGARRTLPFCPCKTCHHDEGVYVPDVRRVPVQDGHERQLPVRLRERARDEQVLPMLHHGGRAQRAAQAELDHTRAAVAQLQLRGGAQPPHSHTVTQAHIHAAIQSHSHTITQSHNHPVTQSHNHTITQSPSLGHRAHHSQTITQSRSHTITQSHSHTVTQSYITQWQSFSCGSAPQSHSHTIKQSPSLGRRTHHSHTITQSRSYTITQSYNHTVTQFHNHTVIQSHSHTVTQWQSFSCGSAPQSHSHTVTQSHSHCLSDVALITVASHRISSPCVEVVRK
eukprot:618363-Prorocentrum_minimum.AAC.1